jgi:hypothetical protein
VAPGCRISYNNYIVKTQYRKNRSTVDSRKARTFNWPLSRTVGTGPEGLGASNWQKKPRPEVSGRSGFRGAGTRNRRNPTHRPFVNRADSTTLAVRRIGHPEIQKQDLGSEGCRTQRPVLFPVDERIRAHVRNIPDKRRVAAKEASGNVVAKPPRINK